MPRLPLRVLQEAEAFFIAVFERHQSEAVVILFANPNTKEWRMIIPIQTVTNERSVVAQTWKNVSNR